MRRLLVALGHLLGRRRSCRRWRGVNPAFIAPAESLRLIERAPAAALVRDRGGGAGTVAVVSADGRDCGNSLVWSSVEGSHFKITRTVIAKGRPRTE
jgi:hypothetical protein